MKRKICIFIVLTMVLSLISSCKTEKAVLVDNFSRIDEKQKITDTVRLSVINAKSLNPYNQTEALNLKSTSLIFEPLFSYDENMHTVPVLAEKFEVKDGGRKILVTVKDGVLWHDGKNLSANDVLYTINLILTQNTLYSDGVISRAELKDRKTVEVHFFKPQMNPRAALMFPIVKDRDDIGTGAFKSMGKESFDTYSLLPFEQYHSKKPDIREVKIVSCPDYESVKRLFEVGETDALYFENSDYSAFTKGNEIKVYEYPSNELLYLGINFENSIFWGKSTRQALLYIFDKKKNTQKSAVKADFPINPKSYLYPNELEYKKNFKKAEELLLNDSWTRVDGVFARMIDGVKQDFNITLIALEDEAMMEFYERIEKSLDNFGIECNLNVLPESELYSALVNKQYDIFIGKQTLTTVSDFEKLTGEGNVFGYLNSELNTLVEKIRLEVDEQKLLELYNECCGIFLADVPFIPLFFYKDALAVRGNIPFFEVKN